jgi:hypothetical protein
MKGNELRDESTEEKKQIWGEVDQAASHAPKWVVSRIMSRGQADNQYKPKEATPEGGSS